MPNVAAILRNNEIVWGYRIAYLSGYFSGPVYKEVESEFGVQRPMFATLFCLAHLGELTAKDVCLLTGIPKNSISRAVARLQTRKLIRRAPDPEDSRAAILRLTPRGRRLYEQILPRFRERERAMMSVLSSAERVQLDRLLNKLVIRGDDWTNAY
jgi:DNA-binding MarR family transcriptional regulator